MADDDKTYAEARAALLRGLSPIVLLIGKTVERIDGAEQHSEELWFYCTDGTRMKMYHERDCCESVSIEDIEGDMADLIGVPILVAEESTNRDEPNNRGAWADESFTRTFYKFATERGRVTLRWYGSSNGYYSESVDCAWFEKGEDDAFILQTRWDRGEAV